jgi:hypothetical protein
MKINLNNKMKKIMLLLTEYFRNDLDKVRKHMKDIGNGLDDDSLKNKSNLQLFFNNKSIF